MFWYSGQEIYDNFHQGRGPDGLIGGATIVNEVATGYQRRSEQIHRLMARMESAWQGDAAGAALRGAGPLVVEHELSAMALVTAQDLTSRQAGSFGDAKNAVVPMPPKPEPLNPMAMLLSPAALVDLERQVDDYNRAAQHNVDVMDRYADASDYNTTNLPSGYGTLTDDQSGISIVPDATTIDVGDSADDSASHPGADESDSGGPIATGLPPRTGEAVPGGVPVPDGGSVEKAAGAHATVPGSVTPSAPGPAPLPMSPTDAGAGRAPVELSPVAGVGHRAEAGTGGGGTGQPRGGAAVPRGGVLGGRGGVAFAAEEVRSAPRGAGPAVMGGAPVGLGRGRGDEDEERRCTLILEADAEAVFGSDVLTAPQVIGDDEYED